MTSLALHLRRLTIRLCTAAALGVFAIHPTTARAQASIVPASHPVYDWLAEQRVAGRLPAYQFEVRPMARAEIVAQLRTLAATASTLSAFEQRLLTDFRNEFEQERLEANRGFTPAFFRGLPSSLITAIRDRRDPVLYAGTTADSMVSGAVYVMAGSGSLSLTTGSTRIAGLATTSGTRGFLNSRLGLGFHFEADNLWTATHAELVRQLPRYDTDAIKTNSTSSYEYDSFLSYRTPKYFELVMGHGVQAMGAAITDPLILRPDAVAFNFVRLRLGTPRFNLIAEHGQLSSGTMDDSVSYQGTRIANRTAPPRWFVSQRVTWMPTSKVSIVAHDQIIYANRGLDLAYLNPLAPMFMAQERLGDRDNALVGADVIARPWQGTQLLASVLIDDMAVSVKGPFKLSKLVGLEQRLLPGLRLGVGYTWIDPWAYGHWLRLNTYENQNRPLGPALGSNGEELAVRLTAWLPLRTRIMAGVRQIRRGLDPVNAAGVVVRCEGGNVLCGTATVFQPRYAGAEIHDIRRLELEAESELIRGLPIALRLRDDQVTRGTQLRSQRFVDLRFRFGY